MRYQILGSLQIRSGGHWVSPGPRKQSVVLAVLLCHRGEAVSIDRLIDVVWDGRPPRTARDNLQVYVYHLRRALGGRDRIQRRDDGYLLRVASGEVDEDEFERLIAEARQAVAANDMRAAASVYQEALAMWRGPAFGAIADVAALRVEVARLQERRLTAIEECVEANLALDRHGQWTAELTRLVAEHPLRESFRAQLMTALYRSGRQAEALGYFHEGRRISIEELGLDPGPRLRALHQSILDGTLDDEHQPVVARRQATPPPAQLAADIADFTGRDDVLRRIREWIDSRRAQAAAVPVVSLSGMAGIGKSALAVRAANLLRPTFPDGQLHLCMRAGDGTAITPAGALGYFLRALGVPDSRIPDDVPGLVALYRSTLAESRVLIVLDDAVGEWQVRPLLPGRASCAVLVTSRGRLAGLEGALHLGLDVLTGTEGLDLLRHAVGHARVVAEPDMAEDIVRLCAGLPLALRVTAARLSARPQWSLRRIRDLLAKDHRRLDLLTAGDLSVRASLTRSYEHVGEAERRLLRLLGLIESEEFPAALAAAVADLPVDVVLPQLETLVDGQLLTAVTTEEAASPQYRMHGLVRLFVRERCRLEESEAVRHAAVARAAAATLAPADDPGPRHEAARRWLHRIGDRLAAPRWNDAAELLHLVVSCTAPEAGATRWSWCPPTPVGSMPRKYLDDLRLVHLRALDDARAAGEHAGEAGTLYALAAVEIAARDLGSAGPRIAKGGETFSALGEERAAGIGEFALAFLDESTGRLRRARRRYVSACAASHRAGDAYTEATALSGLARAVSQLHDPGTADVSLRRAAMLWENLDQPVELARVELVRGGLHLDTGQAAEAEKAFAAALRALRGRDDTVESLARYGLGEAHMRQGRPGLALAGWDQALRLARSRDQLPVRARTLLTMAQLYLDSGLGMRAIVPAGHALTAFQQLGDEVGQRHALTALADAHSTGEQLPADPPGLDPGVDRSAAVVGDRPGPPTGEDADGPDRHRWHQDSETQIRCA
ncbi:BTAD domain-containing putative transcriptional regulator [Micromonospora zhanjiangensis]